MAFLTFQVAGPAQVYAFVGAGGTPGLLGYSDGGVRVSVRLAHEDVHCDLMGDQVPTDVMLKGADALVSLRLRLWDQAVLSAVMTVGNPFNSAFEGAFLPGYIGGLLGAEGGTFRLLVVPPYASFKPSQAATLPWNFPMAFLYSSADFEGLGMRATAAPIQFRAIPALSPTTGVAVLYNRLTDGLGQFGNFQQQGGGFGNGAFQVAGR